MGHVTVTLNGRSYRLRCGEGEEERLFALAQHVREKLDALVQEFGQAGDDRLLLLAALQISDELFDAREQLQSRSPMDTGRPGKQARAHKRADAGSDEEH